MRAGYDPLATYTRPKPRLPVQKPLKGLGKRPKLDPWGYAGMTTTKRTIKLMESRGYICDVVERWIHFGKPKAGDDPKRPTRKDLFGIGDVLCVGPDVVLVQTTSGSNVSSRVAKIAESSATPILRRAGVRIVVHGWRKLKGGWAPREVDAS